MQFLSPPSSSRPGSVIAIGKIPTHPEFLQNRTRREPEQSFDTWLEVGMGLASYRYGSMWTNAFELGRVQGFVWRAPRASGCEALLSGLLFPSCDSVGRHYPLAVVCSVPQRVVMRAPHVLPLAFGDFLERAHDAAADFSVLSPGDLAARLLALGPPSEDDFVRANADYDAWCSAARIDAAWSAIFADHPIERSQAVVHGLRAAIEPVRGVEAPLAGLTVRLPLGQGGPASAALWLDVVRRLCHWNATVPSAFWAVDDGSLLVALGDADPAVLSALWYRDPNNEHVYEPGANGYPSNPPGDPQAQLDITMTELLASLAR
jgi:type VI secretion system protein ImpM